MGTTNFHHTGNIGDVWAAIPAMRKHWMDTGKKVNLYLEKDVQAYYYEGAIHPTKDADGTSVMLNQKMIDMMVPLLKEQPFINEAKAWEGEDIKVHLSWFRDTHVGMPNFSINRWYFYIYPDLTCDLSQRWLVVPSCGENIAIDKILVTRSERYTNPSIDYSFLKPYEDDIVFCGTQREWNGFCMAYDLNVKKLHVNNFLELAQAIYQCRFHITNQTQAFQLSEGQKTPRVLELCTFAANCIPIGENAYDFHAQLGLEYAFHKLNGTVDQYFEKIKAEQVKKEAAI